MIKTKKSYLFLILFLIAGMTSGLLKARARFEPSQDPQVQQLIIDLSKAFEAAAAKISPSVVPIFAEQIVQVQSPFGGPEDPFKDFFGEDFFKQFFGEGGKPEKQIQHSLGSGVIVSKDGYILTNNHVVAGAEKLTVALSDKKTYQAKVIGTDPQTDVAVIKISAGNLLAANLGDSDKVKVGEWVIAVGNPFQLMHTVTAGIISAKGRSMVGLADFEDFVQTDASINPGNSGGALADLEGNVIGINTAITSPSGGNIGIGFAIPINMARQVMDQLIAKGKVIRGYLGVTLQNIDDNLAKALKLKSTEGAIVAEVAANGPAAKAGIQQGDIIIEFNGQKISDNTQIRNLVAQSKPQTQAKVGLLRKGTKMEVTVELGELQKERTGKHQEKEKPEEQPTNKLGLSAQTLTPNIAQQLGYDKDHGVVVTDVVAGSPADDAGLQKADLIKEVNRIEIRTVQDFNREITKVKKGSTVALLVRRGPNQSYVTIQVQ